MLPDSVCPPKYTHTLSHPHTQKKHTLRHAHTLISTRLVATGLFVFNSPPCEGNRATVTAVTPR